MKIGQTEVTILKSDITKLEVDAIVNAANSDLTMGGGVAGALRRAGGSEIEQEAISKGPIPVGRAVETKAGKLKAKYVIHAPTMETPGPTTKEKVSKATAAALKRANELSLTSLAIPGMGTGVGRVHPREAAESVIAEVAKHLKSKTSLKGIVLVDIADEMVSEFSRALSSIR